MKTVIKKILSYLKPNTIRLKEFNRWEDIGDWNNFSDIGKTL